jgi:hypothetical protein
MAARIFFPMASSNKRPVIVASGSGVLPEEMMTEAVGLLEEMMTEAVGGLPILGYGALILQHAHGRGQGRGVISAA